MSEPDDPVGRVRDAIAYPAFNPAFVPVLVDPDTLHVRVGPWSGPAYTLRDVDADGKIETLVDRIDGETPVEDVLAPFGVDDREEIATFLLKLFDRDVVYDRERSDRDGAWPHLVLKPRFAREERRRIDACEVVVVECGPPGRQIAADLADLGVGAIGLVRPGSSDARPIPDREVVTTIDADALEEAVEAADFVVYAADRPRPNIARAVDAAARERGTPWTGVQIRGFDGLVGPTIFPGETACYRCFEERTLANVSDRDAYRRYLATAGEASESIRARIPGFGRMLAGYLTMDLVHLLSCGTGYTAGRVFAVDAMDLSVECNDVLKLPRCPGCGTDAGDAINRFADVDAVVDAAARLDLEREESR